MTLVLFKINTLETVGCEIYIEQTNNYFYYFDTIKIQMLGHSTWHCQK